MSTPIWDDLRYGGIPREGGQGSGDLVIENPKLTTETRRRGETKVGTQQSLPRPCQLHGPHQRLGLVETFLIFAFRD
jgi:hypothetical protein